jgi:hypothetical protein
LLVLSETNSSQKGQTMKTRITMLEHILFWIKGKVKFKYLFEDCPRKKKVCRYNDFVSFDHLALREMLYVRGLASPSCMKLGL